MQGTASCYAAISASLALDNIDVDSPVLGNQFYNLLLDSAYFLAGCRLHIFPVFGPFFLGVIHSFRQIGKTAFFDHGVHGCFCFFLLLLHDFYAQLSGFFYSFHGGLERIGLVNYHVVACFYLSIERFVCIFGLICVLQSLGILFFPHDGVS